MVVDAAAKVLSDKASLAENTIKEHLSQRFEWACTELGVDEAFLLCRLSKPEAAAPYGSTLPLSATQPLSSSGKRTLARVVAEIPDELIGFARLLCLSHHGYEKAQKKEALPNPRLEAVEELDASWPGATVVPGTSVAVTDVLCGALQLRANKYPTTAEQTLSLLASCNLQLDHPERMALVVRAGDQVILREHQIVFELVRTTTQAAGAAAPTSNKRARRG